MYLLIFQDCPISNGVTTWIPGNSERVRIIWVQWAVQSISKTQYSSSCVHNCIFMLELIWDSDRSPWYNVRAFSTYWSYHSLALSHRYYDGCATVFPWPSSSAHRCSHVLCFQYRHSTRFMGPTWGPPGTCRPQMGPMLAPWTMLSGYVPPYLWSPAPMFPCCEIPVTTIYRNGVWVVDMMLFNYYSTGPMTDVVSEMSQSLFRTWSEE